MAWLYQLQARGVERRLSCRGAFLVFSERLQGAAEESAAKLKEQEAAAARVKVALEAEAAEAVAAMEVFNTPPFPLCVRACLGIRDAA